MVSATNGLYWGFHDMQYRRRGLSRLCDNGFFSDDLGSFLIPCISRTPVLEGKFLSKKMRLMHAQIWKSAGLKCVPMSRVTEHNVRGGGRCLLFSGPFHNSLSPWQSKLISYRQQQRGSSVCAWSWRGTNSIPPSEGRSAPRC
jgi:hypothetical protein